MPYTTGQVVMHPFHGTVTVRDVVVRDIRGKHVEYIEMTAGSGLSISVPSATADEIGLRPAMSRAQVDELLTVLRDPALPVERSWARRIKDYQLRVQSGRILERAVVLREIWRRSGHHATGIAERDLMRACRDVLVAEVGLALTISDEDALTLLEEAVGPTPAGPVTRGRSRDVLDGSAADEMAEDAVA